MTFKKGGWGRQKTSKKEEEQEIKFESERFASVAFNQSEPFNLPE